MKVKIKKESENYFINEDAKTIACVVELEMSYKDSYMLFKASGKAKCSEHDVYDEKIGKRIAYTRAKIKALREMREFLDTPFEEAKKALDFVLYSALKVEGCINAEVESLKRLLDQ